MTNSKNTSNSDLRDRMDALRLEIKADINAAITAVANNQGRLEKKFDDLEAGRLTRAEANIQDLKIELLKTTDTLRTNQAVISTKVVVLWAIASALISMVGGATVARLIK